MARRSKSSRNGGRKDSGNNNNPPQKRHQRRRGHPDPDAEIVALPPSALMDDERFICKLCERVFVREQNLKVHARKHNIPSELKKNGVDDGSPRKKAYICPIPTCRHHDIKHALSDITGIKKHYGRAHNSTKRFACAHCDKRYAVEADLKAHAKLHLKDDKGNGAECRGAGPEQAWSEGLEELANACGGSGSGAGDEEFAAAVAENNDGGSGDNDGDGITLSLGVSEPLQEVYVPQFDVPPNYQEDREQGQVKTNVSTPLDLDFGLLEAIPMGLRGLLAGGTVAENKDGGSGDNDGNGITLSLGVSKPLQEVYVPQFDVAPNYQEEREQGQAATNVIPLDLDFGLLEAIPMGLRGLLAGGTDPGDKEAPAGAANSAPDLDALLAPAASMPTLSLSLNSPSFEAHQGSNAVNHGTGMLDLDFGLLEAIPMGLRGLLAGGTDPGDKEAPAGAANSAPDLDALLAPAAAMPTLSLSLNSPSFEAHQGSNAVNHGTGMLDLDFGLLEAIPMGLRGLLAGGTDPGDKEAPAGAANSAPDLDALLAPAAAMPALSLSLNSPSFEAHQGSNAVNHGSGMLDLDFGLLEAIPMGLRGLLAGGTDPGYKEAPAGAANSAPDLDALLAPAASMPTTLSLSLNSPSFEAHQGSNAVNRGTGMLESLSFAAAEEQYRAPYPLASGQNESPATELVQRAVMSIGPNATLMTPFYLFNADALQMPHLMMIPSMGNYYYPSAVPSQQPMITPHPSFAPFFNGAVLTNANNNAMVGGSSDDFIGFFSGPANSNLQGRELGVNGSFVQGIPSVYAPQQQQVAAAPGLSYASILGGGAGSAVAASQMNQPWLGLQTVYTAPPPEAESAYRRSNGAGGGTRMDLFGASGLEGTSWQFQEQGRGGIFDPAATSSGGLNKSSGSFQ